MYLTLTNVTKQFPARDRGSSLVTAVDDVTLTIEKGELVTLLGPSGCGKTTTLRLIAGFEFPTSGAIVLDGVPINEQPPNKRDMAMVFQSYAIFPHLNVFENIAYGLRVKRLSTAAIRTRVAGVLDLVQLSGLENRAPNQLSGGQQQRVALARALIMEPKVLLFDEPLSNLDAKLREQMRVEIREIQKRLGITSVYVTHDQVEAMTLSDRIVIMHKGRIEQVGTPSTIYRHPASRFVADFIGKANFIRARVRSLESRRLYLEAFGDRSLIVAAPDDPPAAGAEVVLVIRPEAIALNRGGPMKGEVIRTSYLGATVEYEVMVEGGEHLHATEYDPAQARIQQVGNAVQVSINEDALLVLAADGASQA